MKTKEYNKFKFAEANRKLKTKSNQHLVESMQKFGFISGRPILITKDFVVIDGQNRLKVAKELGIEVHYEFIEGDHIEKMIALNSSQSNWSLQNYIESFSTQNIDCYRKLVKFEEKYKLGMTNSISICISNLLKPKGIREGKIFVFNPLANEIAEFILDCKNLIPYYKEKEFIRSIVVLFKKTTEAQREKTATPSISISQSGRHTAPRTST